MTLFLSIYFSTAVVVIAAVFVLSLFEEKHRACRGVLLAVYIVAILGVLFATGCLEVRYGWNRLWLYSTVVAAVILVCVYLADRLGGKLRKKRFLK